MDVQFRIIEDCVEQGTFLSEPLADDAICAPQS